MTACAPVPPREPICSWHGKQCNHVHQTAKCEVLHVSWHLASDHTTVPGWVRGGC